MKEVSQIWHKEFLAFKNKPAPQCNDNLKLLNRSDKLKEAVRQKMN